MEKLESDLRNAAAKWRANAESFREMAKTATGTAKVRLGSEAAIMELCAVEVEHILAGR
jgi:hypothetical protein